MSRKPTSEGAAEVIDLVRNIERAKIEQRRLREETQRLAELTEDLDQASVKLSKLLDGMDCATSGNHGWASRVAWLITEVIRQVEKRCGICGVELCVNCALDHECRD